MSEVSTSEEMAALRALSELTVLARALSLDEMGLPVADGMETEAEDEALAG
jgi:hypothetical protein